MSQTLLEVKNLGKTFTLHTQGGVRIPVFDGVSFSAVAGECVVLTGPSGSGKSTLLRSLYGNYKPTSGSIRFLHEGEWVELTNAIARRVLDLRARTVGYVSQFLRVIPRVSALDIVAEPLLAHGESLERARRSAADMLSRLNVPEKLWQVPPATFSGGEQQRINIARSFVRRYSVMLVDEPTASLDVANRAVVVDLIEEAKTQGSAVVGIFHDQEVREQVASTALDVASFSRFTSDLAAAV